MSDRAVVTRLGEGLDEHGVLQAEPMRRTADAVVDMVEESRRLGVEQIAAVATAGMRIAKNSDELIEAVRDRCGVGIEVISGEEEARLAYIAATSELDLGQGRSSSSTPAAEAPSSRSAARTRGGALQRRRRRRPRTPRASASTASSRTTHSRRLVEAIAADLARLDGRPRPDALVGMGGANTNLAAVQHQLAEYDADVVHGTVLDREEIDRQIELYRSRNADERREIVGLQPARAKVILAGALIVRTVLDKLDCDELTVCDRGLRHGVLVERFGS